MSKRSMITSGDVAHMLGLQSAWSFLHRRPELEASGFPAPMPWSKRPLLWKRSEVDFWIEHASEIAAGIQEAKEGSGGLEAENVVMMAKARVA